MVNNLVVNPFMRLAPSDEPEVDFLLEAPKPRCGLQTLKISKSKQPNLYEVFLDLSAARFDLLDIEIDIDAAERELLYQSGILLEPENLPQKPLFACYLDEIESRDLNSDNSALVVNPNFRFEPFDFANPRSWVKEKCFALGKSMVWLKHRLTELEVGYWLSDEQAAVISNFRAGEKPVVSVEPELLSKLTASEILISPKIFVENERRQREILEKAKITYRRDKYVILHEIMPAAQMSAMRRYYRQYVSNGFMPFEDVQSKRFYQHSEPLAKIIHKNLARLMSLVVDEEIIPSYVYAASYIENSDLKPHTDRKQCEFSISFQVDFLPETENHHSPWELFLWQPDFGGGGAIHYGSDKFPAASAAEDINPRVCLASGDGLIYKGRELIHYRYPLSEGYQSTSLFFHYVPKDFEGKLT